MQLQTFLILGDLGGLSVSACLFTLLLTTADVVVTVLKVRSWFCEGATKNHPRFYYAFELT